jgi:hypothetical protein
MASDRDFKDFKWRKGMTSNIWSYKKETFGLNEICFRVYRKGIYCFCVFREQKAQHLVMVLNKGENQIVNASG